MSFQRLQSLAQPFKFAFFAPVVFMGMCQAQEVTKVYPRYAVLGAEARFTAEGTALPKVAGKGIGMKHAFSKSASCTNAQRYRLATTTRYYFSCDMEAATGNPKLTVLSSDKHKETVRLWEGPIQILPGSPKVNSVIVSVLGGSGQTHIRCDSVTSCVTYFGDMQAGKTLNIEVAGSNLPHTLFAAMDGCTVIAPAPDWNNTTTSRFNCPASPVGNSRLQLFSAPPGEGGEILFNYIIQFGS